MLVPMSSGWMLHGSNGSAVESESRPGPLHGSQHSDPKRVTAVMMKDGSNAGSQGDAVARLHAGLA